MFKSKLTAIGSKIDRNGNTYWAFEFLDFETEKLIGGIISGGESNIDGIRYGFAKPYEWDRSVLFEVKRVGIREFNKLTKDFEYFGCRPSEIAEKIKKSLR